MALAEWISNRLILISSKGKDLEVAVCTEVGEKNVLQFLEKGESKAILRASLCLVKSCREMQIV